MLLAIDCGNTQTVIGLFDDQELLDHWRIATVVERTSDELALMFHQFLAFDGASGRSTSSIISSPPLRPCKIRFAAVWGTGRWRKPCAAFSVLRHPMSRKRCTLWN